MPDLMNSACDWLTQQRRQYLSRPVTYVRGETQVALPATPGRTVFRTDDAHGGMVYQRTRDYLVATADLILDDQPTRPQRGDQIHEVIDGQTHVHEVVSINGEPEWRFSDPHQQTIRIHTQFLETL